VENLQRFFREVVAELRKVTWPTKDEIIGSTIVTVVVSLIMSLFIGSVDRVLTLMVKAVFSAGIGG